MTDFEKVFEDGEQGGVMQYAEKKLGAFKGGSRQDLQDFIERSDPLGKTTRIMDKLLETRAAQRYIQGEEKPAPKKAAPKIPPELRQKVAATLKSGYAIHRRGANYYRVEKGGRVRDLRTGRFASKVATRGWSSEYPFG